MNTRIVVRLGRRPAVTVQYSEALLSFGWMGSRFEDLARRPFLWLHGLNPRNILIVLVLAAAP